MKRYFIAYRHTGEDMLELGQRLSTIEIALAVHRIKSYATLSEENEFVKDKYSASQIMQHAFQKINAMDGLFVLINSDEKSEGQLMEIGYAIAKRKPVIVAYRKGSKTYVPELATFAIEFTDMQDLAKKIKQADL